MTLYFLLKWLHVIGAATLFGTGMGIAFFMFMVWRSGDRAAFAVTARHVVLADFLFTTTAVIIQPFTGFALAHAAGWPLASPWLLASYALYILVGLCWLPVVWIQMRVRHLLAIAEDSAATVDRLMKIWFALGWPAFGGVLAIFALMIAKPDF